MLLRRALLAGATVLAAGAFAHPTGAAWLPPPPAHGAGDHLASPWSPARLSTPRKPDVHTLETCLLGTPTGHLDMRRNPLCRRGIELPAAAPSLTGTNAAGPSTPCAVAPGTNQRCPAWVSVYNDPSIARFSDQLPTATAIDPSGRTIFVGVDDLDAGLDIDHWVVLAENAATGD